MFRHVGTDLTIQEEPGANLTTDLFGIQVLTRPFRGPQTDLVKFLADYEADLRDRILPDLLLTDHNFTTQRGGIISGNLTFKGVPGLAAGKPAFSKTTVEKALVTKRAVIRAANDKGQQVEIEYKAPATTYMYARATEPTEGRFVGAMRYFQHSFKIIKSRGFKRFPMISVTPMTFALMGLGAYNKDAFYIGIKIVTQVLDCKQVGSVWQVTERNDGMLFDVFEDLHDDLDKTSQAPKESAQQVTPL